MRCRHCGREREVYCPPECDALRCQEQKGALTALVDYELAQYAWPEETCLSSQIKTFLMAQDAWIREVRGQAVLHTIPRLLVDKKSDGTWTAVNPRWKRGL